ncbi:hypothetical protein [Spirosoma sp. 209]|uniref:hypothetical protein n=1 Tax=Spirosoma sp. 209 TaxID=1955701 RepID=UPI00098D6057|nr:hypothetical protein [Spirosoma sp. 209]
MAIDQQTSNLITTTINAFNGDSKAVSPLDGVSLIDSWTSALRDADGSANPVSSSLNDLKAELQSGNPDSSQIRQLLNDLTEQARAVANSADTDVKTRLNSLIEALEGFGNQLGGSANMTDAKNQQAPMSSTVGGESTTSGSGVPPSQQNDNDFSDRNGGTVDRNSSAMGMDDTTGSDGARMQDGGSYGSGYGTGSDGDDYSANSGTQRSGVSGGTADSGSGSSGGRSQY